MAYFLGADLGGTKTHAAICDETGQILGFGESGPGNHEVVDYEGFQANLELAVSIALQQARIERAAFSGSGFGVGGYDWPIEKEPTLRVISTLHLSGKIELVNDSELGLLAGSPRLWGIAVVSGTGCNCRGWDESHTHFGRVTGGGLEYGEGAGAAELIARVQKMLAEAWTGQGPSTALAEAFCTRYQVRDLGELLQGLICHNFSLSAADAPLIFEVAAKGDAMANEAIHWAGRKLGQMACTVIRQLHFEQTDFDVVEIGGMWEGSPVLSDEMSHCVHAIAPHAHILRSDAPPVIGALLLGMQAAEIQPAPSVRTRLIQSARVVLGKEQK